MELIVELVSRSQKTIERHYFDKTSITIGRAYDNDLIISEPHVCPHHAILRKDIKDDGSWVLSDLKSRNGTFTQKGSKINDPTNLKSGSEFMAGKMRIRIFNPDHQVKPAIALSAIENLFNILSRPGLAILLTFIILSLSAYGKYLQSFTKVNTSDFGIGVLAFFMMILIWASIWAFVGRLLRHEPRFITQFIISAFVFLLFNINEFLSTIIAFNTLSLFWIYAYDYLSNGLLLVLLFALNLRFAIQQSNWKRRTFANIFAWAIIGSLALFQVSEDSDFKTTPAYVQALLPKSLLWASPISQDTFIDKADSIFKPYQE